MSQTERILYIDRSLRTRGSFTVQQVADYFEVSSRQVKRDIEYLRDRFNAPIIFDRFNMFYKYETDFKELAFADQNLVLFYVVLKSLVENQHYIPVVSDDIISNIAKDVPESYKHICDNISFELRAVRPSFLLVCLFCDFRLRVTGNFRNCGMKVRSFSHPHTYHLCSERFSVQ